MRISAMVCPYSLYEDGLLTGGQVGFPALPLAACHRLCWRPAVKTSLDRVMYHGGVAGPAPASASGLGEAPADARPGRRGAGHH